MNDAAAKSIHITGLFPELLGIGGVQEAGRLTALAIDEIARQRGWSAAFAGLNDPAGPQQLSIAGRELTLQGFARAKLGFIRFAIAAARAAHNREAHVIVAGHPNLAPIAMWMQKMSRHASAIVMAHGVDVWHPLPRVRRATIRHAHIVTAPSADTIQKLIQVQRVPRANTQLLPWPLNPDFLALTERDGLRPPAGFPDATTILTIGRAASAEQYKGTDDLIQAVAKLESAMPDVHLVCVGAGDDLRRLQSLARGLDVAGRVHFLQRLSGEEIAACYSRARIFAMPSAGEGFGLVFLEAMAFGKPIIAAACGGAVDLVEDGFNGLLVPPRDPAALTLALTRLLENEALRSRLGANGTAIARGKYRFDSFRCQLEQLLERCIGRC
ncbi:MAG TPA: glycosyltransferase family 4 protein [Candidatus Aquilonibacter sp.]|nr:glycosyltransferase family 4 protein [Candidatus Aquilonibacter sp.]